MIPGVLKERRGEFGAYLREQRCARGFSLREAASRLGLSAAWLSRIETGGPARVTSGQLLNAFADLYGIPVAEVLDRAGFRVDPAELASAAVSPRGLRRQRVVTVAANGDAAAAINALIAEGWRVVSVVPVGAASAGSCEGRLLVVVEP